jgi:hypothetical protein
MTPSKIMQHEPICTVLAEADQAIDAQALVLERADQLAALIFN